MLVVYITRKISVSLCKDVPSLNDLAVDGTLNTTNQL